MWNQIRVSLIFLFIIYLIFWYDLGTFTFEQNIFFLYFLDKYEWSKIFYFIVIFYYSLMLPKTPRINLARLFFDEIINDFDITKVFC